MNLKSNDETCKAAWTNVLHNHIHIRTFCHCSCSVECASSTGSACLGLSKTLKHMLTAYNYKNQCTTMQICI